ncbi:hypothetical protein SLS64_005746 [Diaporthe eres]|uniref:Uncharacterized protein n=1 Tax=Diaporthe eres TaxID=83184 RepID=A0ABR1P826_DIAER
MVPIAQAPKDVLARWEENGQLQTKSWVARINESVLSFPGVWDFSTMQLSKLDPYCKTSHDGEPCLELSGFTAILKRFVPEPAWAGLDATAPVLWQIFTYIGGYPFLTSETKSETRDRLSRTEFICAVSFLHPGFSDRLFNSDNDERTRARTNADQRRLIFQALASPQPRRQWNAGDESLWASKAAERAARYWDPRGNGDRTAREPHNKGCNRGADGDECFHDLLDFMYAFQPVEDGPPVPRSEFVGVAKNMVERGEVVLTPLHEMGMARGRFEGLVEFLLVMYLEGSVDNLEELPSDFSERKDKVVTAFYGGYGKGSIDFLEFDKVLSAGTSEIMGGKEFVTNEFPELLMALEWILDTYIPSLLKPEVE